MSDAQQMAIPSMERCGCTLYWLVPPWKDMILMRVTGAIENIEEFSKVYAEIYARAEVRFGNPRKLHDGTWVAIWMRWVDDV